MRTLPPPSLPPPSPSSEFPFDLFSLNVARGFTPTLSNNNCTKDKLARVCDGLRTAACACLQELDFPSDCPPPSVLAVLRERGLTMECAGTRKGKAASVGIVLGAGWRFEKVFRTKSELPSACVIGAAVTNGSSSVFVASLKLPPGLDSSCGRWRTDPKQQCARRLVQVVLDWAASYTVKFLCGDFNLTASCCRDRAPSTCPSDCGGTRPGNLIAEVLLNPANQLFDVFRELHPG